MGVSALSKKVIVTAALPYANARLHLGHLRSTYIPADIYVRYLRAKGVDAIYVCATDEHGTPIAVMAEQSGKSCKDYVDYYHKLILEDLLAVGCSFDIFARTTNPEHYELTQEFFKRLLEKGYIYEEEYEQLYCPKCKRFLPDRYVEGVCPYCGSPGARGDACDACGRYLKPSELKEPYCIICKSTPELRTTRHWFFKLSAFQEFLEKWIKENERLPDNVKNFALQWIKEGLMDWCITRDLDWGVPVPVEGAEGKVIYVWFDAPIGYISSTIRYAEERGKPEVWKDYWQNPDAEIVHFIGKDIIYHHAIFWPAMLRAHGDFNLPTIIVAGEFLTLEGKKMSKSRGWVVEIKDYVAKFDPDSLRYYLAVSSPLTKDADFSWDEFLRRHNNELADVLGNFVHRALTFAYRNFGEKIPSAKELDDYDKQAIAEIEKAHSEASKYLDQFDFHSAIRRIIDLASFGNKYFNDKEPWNTIKTDPDKAATTIHVSCRIAKALAIMLAPFIPNAAERMWSMLNLPGSVHEQPWDEALKDLPPDHLIPAPKPLFTKIEPKVIREQKEILRRSLAERTGEAEAPKVSIDEFKKMDLRVGTIIEVERVPGSKNLYKLKIDLGELGIRQSVAGIAPWYKEDELLNKQVAVIANLQPAKIFGVESEVMILAAEDEEGVSILQPDKKKRNGSKIL